MLRPVLQALQLYIAERRGLNTILPATTFTILAVFCRKENWDPLPEGYLSPEVLHWGLAKTEGPFGDFGDTWDYLSTPH